MRHRYYPTLAGRSQDGEANKWRVRPVQLPIPATPPMWYKPAASLADPGSEIPFPVQAQLNFPDFEVCGTLHTLRFHAF